MVVGDNSDNIKTNPKVQTVIRIICSGGDHRIKNVGKQVLWDARAEVRDVQMQVWADGF